MFGFSKENDIRVKSLNYVLGQNSFIKIILNGYSFRMSEYMEIGLLLKNISNDTLNLNVIGGKMIIPANEGYLMLNEEETVKARSKRGGFWGINIETDDTINTGSEEYIKKHFLKSIFIAPKDSIFRLIVFPFPDDLKSDPTLINLSSPAFHGKYNIILNTINKEGKEVILPELIFDFDDYRKQKIEYEKQFIKVIQ